MCSQQPFPSSPFSASPSAGPTAGQDARLTSWLLAASAGAPNDYNRFLNAAMSMWQTPPPGMLSPGPPPALAPIMGAGTGPGQPGCYPAAPGGLFPLDPLRPFHPFCTEMRMPFFREEPKPNHSYIGLIAMGILSSKDRKMVLSEIYQWIQDNYPYFRTKGPGWRNSIRHNLSLNDCFVKCGRSSNGKGHYWTIHEANIEDFMKGDFRRRRAQRKVRKHMGLSCGDDDDTPSPSPTDARTFEWPSAPGSATGTAENSAPLDSTEEGMSEERAPSPVSPLIPSLNIGGSEPKKRRGFDMASLLAPDDVQTSSHPPPPPPPPMPFALWHSTSFPSCFHSVGISKVEDGSLLSPKQNNPVLEES